MPEEFDPNFVDTETIKNIMLSVDKDFLKDKKEDSILVGTKMNRNNLNVIEEYFPSQPLKKGKCFKILNTSVCVEKLDSGGWKIDYEKDEDRTNDPLFFKKKNYFLFSFVFDFRVDELDISLQSGRFMVFGSNIEKENIEKTLDSDLDLIKFFKKKTYYSEGGKSYYIRMRKIIFEPTING